MRATSLPGEPFISLCAPATSCAGPGSDLLWTAHLHDPILEALQRHDQRAVVHALRHHFRDARTMLARVWAEQKVRTATSGTDGDKRQPLLPH